jgi:hypothetical protein
MRSIFGGNEWVQSWVLPDEIEAVPMRLMRAQLYPGRPELVVQGINEYGQNLANTVAGSYRPPEMFPIRMTQVRHKLAPAPTVPTGPVVSAYAALHVKSGARGVVARLAAPPAAVASGYVPMHMAPRAVGASRLAPWPGPDMRPVLRAQGPRAEYVAGPMALHDPQYTKQAVMQTTVARARAASNAPIESATRHLMRKAGIGR